MLAKTSAICPSPRGLCLTLHSRINPPSAQNSKTHIPEHRKDSCIWLPVDDWVHMQGPSHYPHWGSVHKFPVPALCLPSLISLRLSPGYQWPKYTGLDLKVAFVFNVAESLKPAHVTNCLFPSSCCVTLLPTPRDVACHSFNFTGKCLGEPLSSLINNRRGQSLLEVTVKHLWGLLRIRQAEKRPIPSGKTLPCFLHTVQSRGPRRCWGEGTCTNDNELSRQERNVCEGEGGDGQDWHWPSQTVHCLCSLRFI